MLELNQEYFWNVFKTTTTVPTKLCDLRLRT